MGRKSKVPYELKIHNILQKLIFENVKYFVLMKINTPLWQ